MSLTSQSHRPNLLRTIRDALFVIALASSCAQAPGRELVIDDADAWLPEDRTVYMAGVLEGRVLLLRDGSFLLRSSAGEDLTSDLGYGRCGLEDPDILAAGLWAFRLASKRMGASAFERLSCARTGRSAPAAESRYPSNTTGIGPSLPPESSS